MRLFCDSCKEVHEFTPGEVERLVYTMVGVISTAAGERDYLPAESEYLTCLHKEEDASHNCEYFQEYVDGCVEARKTLRGKRNGN